MADTPGRRARASVSPVVPAAAPDATTGVLDPEVIPPAPSPTMIDQRMQLRMAVGGMQTLNAKAAGVSRFVPGLKLRQYELIRELGRGGMGQVFLARDTKLARRVAIKFLSSESQELTARFLVEARTTALVHHENIVVIHDVDEYDGSPHMVLEYLEGWSLRELIDGHPFAHTRALELMIPVVRAIVRAHAAGVIHRDLKPENVFVTNDGVVKVLDFGIAKALTAHEVTKPLTANELELLATTTPIGLTSQSVVVGTPQYMSPEQFGYDVVDQRSDIWAVGIMLFEMLAGKHPLVPYTLQSLMATAAQLDEPMPPIGSVVEDLPDRLERLVDRCLEKRKDARYPDASALLDDLEELDRGHLRRSYNDDDSPYPGLAAFQEADSDRFFGRSREVARVARRLREQPLLGIAGPSGVGKSSFVRAGVVPALKGSGDSWETYIVRPGRQPFASLAGILSPLAPGLTIDGRRASTSNTYAANESLATKLRAEPGYLGTLLRERAARKNTKVLVFIDQFEELYTLVPDQEERRAFTAALVGAADDATSPVRIVLSIRSDFLERVGEHRALFDEVMRGLVLLTPLGRPELCEALTRPLDDHAYEFESDEIVEDMLSQLAAVPGALPLMQFTAARLWDERDRKAKRLTRAAYDAMGGVTGALATHADHVLAGLPVATHRVVRALFQRLVTPERTRAIAERADLVDLGSDVQMVLDHLVQARLLVVQSTDDGGSTVEIVHESLLASWPTLHRWLDEDQEDAAFVAQVASAAKQWDARGRTPGLLWRGDAAADAKRWAARGRTLQAREQAFLDAVLALDRSVKRRRVGAVAAAFAILAAIAVGAFVALVRVRAAQEAANDNAERAEAALSAQTQEETARRKADADRLSAVAALLGEERLREAAEQGLLDAKQLAAIAEAKRLAAESQQAQAEAGLTAAERERARVEAQLRDADASRKAAEDAARKSTKDVELTREQLIAKQKQLEAALASANAARAKADAARQDVEAAKAELQKALAVEKAHAERLEREGKKILKDLK